MDSSIFARQNSGDQKSWWFRNNPLYLLSALLMFLSLHVISQESNAELSLASVMVLFWLQVLYEVVLLSMSLFLFSKGINLFHARILMILVLILSCDITFYQSRIASMCAVSNLSWLGLVSSIFYLIVTVGEMGAIRHVLQLKSRLQTNVYTILSLGIIYLTPHWTQMQIINYSQDHGFGWWQNFLPWLFAAIIQLPVIFSYWYSAINQEDFLAKRKILTERNFFLMTTLVPFFILPLQLTVNVYQDLSQACTNLSNLHLGFLIYASVGVYFLNSCYRGNSFQWQETFLIALQSTFLYFSQFHYSSMKAIYSSQWSICAFLLCSLLFLNVISKRNPSSISVIIASLTIMARNLPIQFLNTTSSLISSMSKFSYAMILCSMAFATLGVGFSLSLKQK